VSLNRCFVINSCIRLRVKVVLLSLSAIADMTMMGQYCGKEKYSL
jgi:hypothetical protein